MPCPRPSPRPRGQGRPGRREGLAPSLSRARWKRAGTAASGRAGGSKASWIDSAWKPARLSTLYSHWGFGGVEMMEATALFFILALVIIYLMASIKKIGRAHV